MGDKDEQDIPRNRHTEFSSTLEKQRYNSKQQLDDIFTYWSGKK